MAGLNSEQQLAVDTVRGPVLVLAGAGSGKTRVITFRITNIIRKGTLPDHVLAVTFTNKASKEMAERLESLIPREIAKRVTVSTFHKLGVKILQQHGVHIGVPQRFTIIDADDQLGLVKDAMRESNVSLERYEADWMRSRISALKNAGIRPGERELRVTDVVSQLVERVYIHYDKAMKGMGAVDFDDLLLKPLELMRARPDILHSLRNQYRYVHVDEFQDTNGVQMELLLLLCGEHRNLCVVGDDDQSIYGWRGARIENVIQFEKHFQEARIIKLTQNYRSTGSILEAANAVIRNNVERREKELWTSSGAGNPVRYKSFETPEDEASWIAKNIVREFQGGKPTPSRVGILFRANSQARAIEQCLREAGLKYRVVGGLTFYDRKEVKDCLAYLKWVLNPNDELALRRILAFPQRGVGEGSIGRILQAVKDSGGSIESLLLRGGGVHGLGQRAQMALDVLREISSARHALETPGTDIAGEFFGILGKVGFREGLWASHKVREEGDRKWENIEEVLAGLRRFSERRGSATASDYLRDLALTQQGDDEPKEEAGIVLMSIHASKGLEFPIVFLPGIEEKLLPHWRSIESGDIPEERRLFYVGITRARETLYLSGCRIRKQFRKTLYCKQSRFLMELPEGIMDAGVVMEDMTEEEAHGAAMASLAFLFQDGDES